MRKHLRFATWLSLAVCLYPCFSIASLVPHEAYDLPELVAIENRLHHPTHELTAFSSWLPSDSFNKYISVGFGYVYRFGKLFGWEVLNAQYAFAFPTSLKKDLETNFPLEVENVSFSGTFDPITFFALSSLFYTPVYGKNLFFDSRVIRSEMTFLATVGVVNFKNFQTRPLGGLGVAFKYFVNQGQSLNLDFRQCFYDDFNRGPTSLTLVSLGYGFH